MLLADLINGRPGLPALTAADLAAWYPFVDWDAAALQPILEEAGGTFTDWRGNRTIYHGEGIGTNRRVLDEVLTITRPHTTTD